MTMLGELAISDGQRQVRGKVGYSSQQPWIFSGTVKENIVFGQEFNKVRYQQVINACALRKVCLLLKNYKVRHLHIFWKCTLFALQNFAQVLFAIPFEMDVIPRRNGKQRLYKILGVKKGVLWEMCKWRVMFTRAKMKLAPLCNIHFRLLLHQPIATHPIFLFYCVLFNLTLKVVQSRFVHCRVQITQG